MAVSIFHDIGNWPRRPDADLGAARAVAHIRGIRPPVIQA
jgi:hypothetical protein